jgi:hypothetical protein
MPMTVALDGSSAVCQPLEIQWETSYEARGRTAYQSRPAFLFGYLSWYNSAGDHQAAIAVDVLSPSEHQASERGVAEDDF